MKAIELRKEVQEYILSELQNSVMRLGISAQLKMVVKKDYRGQEYLTLESEKFQTQPVIFKEVWLDGVISVTGEKENAFEVCVRLDYNWRSFTGGTNCTDLGRCFFEVDKDLPEKLTSENVCYHVNKRGGIEI